MLSYLAGGECSEVSISHLLLEPGELMSQMTPKIEEIRKKISFRLCQCYWRRIRPSMVVKECSNDDIESRVDYCIGNIRSDEGRMDYWQRFIEMNRFIFQLNAHLFSEAYKLQFADLTNRYEEIYHSHQMSHELNLQQEALAQDLHSQTLQVESSLQELSYQLEPLYNLSTRIVRIGKSTWGVIKEAAETSEELKDTFLLLFLALIYLAFYLLVHFSTAFILSQYNVYGWFRTVLAAAMLIDWIVWFPNEFRLLFLVLGSLPISIVINVIASIVERRLEKARMKIEEERMGKLESEGIQIKQWISALLTLDQNQIFENIPPADSESEEESLTEDSDAENVPPKRPVSKTTNHHNSSQNLNRSQITSPKGARRR